MSEQPDLCECEAERAAILEHDAKMPREMAEAMARMWWGESYDPVVRGLAAQRCDHCPRVPKL